MSELIVASGDTAKLLDPAEESLNEVSTFVTMLVEFTLNAAIAARRDNGLNVRGVQIINDSIAVVGLVRTDRTGFQSQQERQGFGAVAGLSTRQMKSGQGTQSFNHGMDLRAQSATGTSERLIAVFLAAPAAC